MKILEILKNLRDFLDEKIQKIENKSSVEYDGNSEDTAHHFQATLKTLKRNKVFVSLKDDGVWIRLAGSPKKGEAFRMEWAKVVDFGVKMTREEKLKKIL